MTKIISLMLALLTLTAALTACATGSDETASVQSVAMICGIGSTVNVERYAGVIESKSDTKIEKDENMSVSEILCEVGDTVEKDQVLFKYDHDQLSLNVEKLQLEIEQLKNTVSSKKKEIEELEKDSKGATGDLKLSYTLQIQELNADITETNYTISTKEKDLEEARKTLENLEVKSPVAGKIQSINKQPQGEETAFIVIRETGDFRIKGYVNETNRNTIYEGMEVLVRSRVDDTVKNGTIKTIDLKNPVSGTSGWYEENDDTQSSSKYPFYIELSDTDGFIIGQHVYIEPDYGQGDVGEDVIALPSYYINDIDGDAWVWAQGKNEKLEKRGVTLGDYDEMNETYVIEEGLSLEDFIAFPEENLKAGMKCVKYDYSEENGEDYMIDDMDGDVFFDGNEFYGDDTMDIVYKDTGVIAK